MSKKPLTQEEEQSEDTQGLPGGGGVKQEKKGAWGRPCSGKNDPRP